MAQIIVEWPFFNNNEEHELGFDGPGPIWEWRLYNMTTKQVTKHCPGGIGDIDGSIYDYYKVFGLNKAEVITCSYENRDLIIRPTSGLCKVSGCSRQLDGSPRILNNVTVEQEDITVNKLTNQYGEFFFYLLPGCKPKLWIEPDHKVLWFQVPNTDAITYEQAQTMGYMIPRRPEP